MSRSTVRSKLTWIMLATLIPLCVGFLTATKERYDSRKQLVYEHQEEASRALAAFVNSWLEDAIVLGASIATSPTTSEFKNEQLETYLALIAEMVPKIKVVFAIDSDWQVYGDVEELRRAGHLYAVYNAARESMEKSSSLVLCLYGNGSPGAVIILYPIRNFKDKIVGTIGVQLKMDHLLHDIRELKKGLSGNYILTDSDGRVVMSTWPSERVKPSTVLNTNRLKKFGISAVSQVSSFGWSAYAVISLKKAMAPVYTGAMRDLALIIISLMATLLLARWLSLGFAKPIGRLEKMVSRLGEGDLVTLPMDDGFDEFQKLSIAFQRMATSLAAVIESHKEKAQALQKAAERLVTAQEDERKRLAREIHDWINQYLVVLFFHIQTVEVEQGDGTALEDICERLKEANVELRRIMNDLHPHLLEEEGLSAACQAHVGEFQARTGISCRVKMDIDENNLSNQHKLMLFRILQEALANVAKHSEATQVAVSITEDEQTIRILVTDNGIGFSVRESSGSGLGLTSMKERAAAIGGELSVSSAPGKGTVVEGLIPKWGESD